MYASVTWINDYLDPPLDAEAQADLLTRAGFPLEERESVDADGRPDVRQDFEMTSNRGDCGCHLGMAREIAAIGGIGFRPPQSDPRPTEGEPDAAALASVRNEDPAGCPRYTARIIRGVTVGPSPQWLADRLRWRGDIPRNNVVDATNFVLFEYGQPTHVFDLDRLAGRGIVIRAARDGEEFLPLGEGAAPVRLHAADLVIADAERPVALAGVKGGAASAVTAGTTDILIEAATFDPVRVRSASRRHGIASDSSYRFERGVHPAAIDAAADRLVSLILEVAGGRLCPGVLEAGGPIPAPRTASMRTARARAVLGVDTPDEAMAGMLDRLGFSPRLEAGVIHCTVPAHRLDVEREIDLVEEVARMVGLDTIPRHEKLAVRVAAPQPRELARRAVCDVLTGLGFIETVTHSLVSEAAAAAFLPAGRGMLRVDDERAGAEPVLRPSVLPSLARVAAFNRDHGAEGVRLFEQAAIFSLEGAEHRESVRLAFLHECREDLANPLRETRGIIDRLVALLRGPDAAVRAEPTDDAAGLEPAARLWLEDRPLGSMGLLSGSARASVGLQGAWAAAELTLPELYESFPPDREATSLPAFPAIDRDLTLVVADAVSWAAVTAAIDAAAPAAREALERIEYVDCWRGPGLPEAHRSLSLRLRFRRSDRTLTHEEIDPAVAMIVAAVREATGGELRS
jgi:phenylalanyl-tRNA synthetase beta chain